MRIRPLIPYLVLAALPCLLLFPILEGRVLLPANLLHDVYPWRSSDPKTLVPWNVLQFDGVAEFYPWRLLAARTWREGYVPLWNPYELCGTPLLANSQSAVMYPPNLLFAIMPVADAFGVSALLHLFLTGAFLYLFLRRSCGLTRAAALFGAAAWQLSTWQVSWLALPTFLDTSCWLPLALLMTDRVAERPSFGRALALSLVLGLMLLAGHLQIAFYCLLLTLAYAIFSVVHRRTSLAAALGCAVCAAGFMLMVAAPQILPVLELSRVSHRAGTSASAAGYAGYVALALPARHLVTLFLPDFFGRPDLGTYWDDPRFNFAEVACYVGVTVFILAALGTIACWRSHKNARFFAVWALAALLLALGTPLDAILYFGVPGFGATGSPARVLVIWALCLPVLSAYGMEALLDRAAAKKGAVIAAFAASLALLGATFAGVYFWLSANAPAALANIGAASTDLRLYAGFFLAGAAIVYFFLKGSLPRNAAAALLVCLAAADLIRVGYGYNPIVRPSEVYPPTALTQWLAANAGSYRVMPMNHAWGLGPQGAPPPPTVLPPNAATAFALPETQGYDSLQTGRYVGFASAMDSGQQPSPPENGNMIFTYGAGTSQAREAGARYLVSVAPLSGFGAPVFTDGQTEVYQDGAALPVARMEDGKAAGATWISPTRIDIMPPVPGTLILAEQWYPGWQVAGTGALLERGPDVFSTVTGLSGPPAVAHLRYQPAAFRTGLYLGLAAILVLAASGTASLAAIKPRRQAP